MQLKMQGEDTPWKEVLGGRGKLQEKDVWKF